MSDPVELRHFGWKSLKIWDWLGGSNGLEWHSVWLLDVAW